MSKGRLLIIEDEPRLRRNLEFLLGRAGYAVSAVATAQDGMVCLDRDAIDVVITDLVMPGFDGFDLLDHLIARRPVVPVIVITGFASSTSAAEAIRRGAQDYLHKPFDMADLRAAIERALERRQIPGGTPASWLDV